MGCTGQGTITQAQRVQNDNRLVGWVSWKEEREKRGRERRGVNAVGKAVVVTDR